MVKTVITIYVFALDEALYIFNLNRTMDSKNVFMTVQDYWRRFP